MRFFGFCENPCIRKVLYLIIGLSEKVIRIKGIAFDAEFYVIYYIISIFPLIHDVLALFYPLHPLCELAFYLSHF